MIYSFGNIVILYLTIKIYTAVSEYSLRNVSRLLASHTYHGISFHSFVPLNVYISMIFSSCIKLFNIKCLQDQIPQIQTCIVISVIMFCGRIQSKLKCTYCVYVCVCMCVCMCVCVCVISDESDVLNIKLMVSILGQN